MEHDIAFVLKQLFAAYPGNKATEGTVAVYVRFLQDIPPRELQAVVDQCIIESEFLPTIAKLKEMHRQMQSGATPDKAADGWLSVQRAMRDPATYTPEPTSFVPKFKDELVGKAVEALGWFNLRMSENPRTDQAQFERLYKMFAEQEASEQRLSPEFIRLREDNRKAVDALAERQRSERESEGTNGIVRRLEDGYERN